MKSRGMSKFELKKNDPISLLRHTNKSSMKAFLSTESKKRSYYGNRLALDQGECITVYFWVCIPYFEEYKLLLSIGCSSQKKKINKNKDIIEKDKNHLQVTLL